MDWSEVLKSKRKSGFINLTKYLEQNGYTVVEHEEGGKHLKIKVRRLEEKDDVNAETVVTTVSTKTSKKASGGRLKMVLKEIQNLFKGRGRRGQGEFKLSENYKQETWTDILKAGRTGYYQFITLLVDADLPVQMARKLNKKAKEMYADVDKTMSDSSVNTFNNKVRRMSVQKRAKIASKIARVYETTDDTSLKPGLDSEKNVVRSQTKTGQFENITNEELEMIVKYMLHLIETM